MKIIISNSSSVPIYEQIKNTIINQIMNDELKEDETLPSIRNLAQDIKISVMTIKKAYDELEQEGYIISRQGKGTFVAPKNVGLAKEQAQKEINFIIKDLKSKSDLTEDMKNTNPLYWVGTMNSIKNQAEEIVLKKLIYV